MSDSTKTDTITQNPTSQEVEDKPKRKYLSEKQAKSVRSYTKFTNARKRKFLRALEKVGNLNSAAAHTGVSRDTVYQHMRKNEDFAKAVEIARGKATFKLEEEAWLRATEGRDKTLYYKGEEIGTEKQYSDRLLERLLEASDRERYAKNTNVNLDANIEVSEGENAKQKLISLLKLEGYIEGEFEEVEE